MSLPRHISTFGLRIWVAYVETCALSFMWLNQAWRSLIFSKRLCIGPRGACHLERKAQYSTGGIPDYTMRQSVLYLQNPPAGKITKICLHVSAVLVRNRIRTPALSTDLVRTESESHLILPPLHFSHYRVSSVWFCYTWARMFASASGSSLRI